MGKKQKKRSFLIRRLKRLEKRRKRQKLLKKQHVIHTAPEPKFQSEADLVQSLLTSDTLWELPELAPFLLPQEVIEDAFTQWLNRTQTLWEKIRQVKKEPSEQELLTFADELLLRVLTGSVKTDLFHRMDRAIERLRFIDPYKTALLILLKEAVDSTDKPTPLIALPFYKKLMERSSPEIEKEVIKHNVTREALFRDVLHVDPSQNLSLPQIHQMMKDPHVMARAEAYFSKHPEIETIGQKQANIMEDQVREAVKEGIFDELLLSDEDMLLFEQSLPKTFIKKLEQQPKEQLSEKEVKQAASSTWKTFLQTYERQGKAAVLKEKIQQKLHDKETRKDTHDFELWEGARLHFSWPFEENSFFHALFKRSAQKFTKQ